MIESFETDSLSVRVPVTVDPGGAPLDLSGATVEASAERNGIAAIAATCIIEHAAGGIVRVQFPPETFAREVYVLHLRVRIGADVQTVLSETIRVRKSVRVT